jgi:hypothetical protein
MKKCLTSPIIKETQVKASVTYHVIPVKMTIIRKKEDQQALALLVGM